MCSLQGETTVTFFIYTTSKDCLWELRVFKSPHFAVSLLDCGGGLSGDQHKCGFRGTVLCDSRREDDGWKVGDPSSSLTLCFNLSVLRHLSCPQREIDTDGDEVKEVKAA